MLFYHHISDHVRLRQHAPLISDGVIYECGLNLGDMGRLPIFMASPLLLGLYFESAN